MIRKSDAHHKFHSAHTRFCKPAIESFFDRELPQTFGPNLRSKIADELILIFEKNNRDTQTIKSGQILWNAVHKNTRADSKNMKLVPVVLTIVAPDDINYLENNGMKRKHRQKVIARIMQEAYQQDALLSSRDIGLLLATHPAYISAERINYEKEENITLPHTGNLQDMGTCITHKYQIVYKYVVEKKDPILISRETNHTLKAVDSYLKDYNRVKLIHFDGKNPEFIKMATGLPLHVIRQYLEIINQYVEKSNAS